MRVLKKIKERESFKNAFQKYFEIYFVYTCAQVWERSYHLWKKFKKSVPLKTVWKGYCNVS